MPNTSGITSVKKVITTDYLEIENKPVDGRPKNLTLDSDREYIIPEYQRAIKWSTENVQVLIDDLRTEGKFLGTITLSTSECKKYEVIDGQQRLTIITMLITCLNKDVSDGKKIKNLCKIMNQSFPYYEDALIYQFDYEKIKTDNVSLHNNIIDTDSQYQRFIFTELWGSIVERIQLLNAEEKEKLLLNLCESELNVIVNEIDGKDTERKFCADYFIDINNKRVELDSLDIIRAYAFKEDFSNATERWVKLQKRCKKIAEKVKYTLESLYFHYFICCVNKEIDYSINHLSKEYRIKESIEIFNKKYSSGTYIWNLFKNDKFYSNLLIELDEYLDFIEIVLAAETGGNDDFKNYFLDEKGNRVDETRILNAHTVINTILRNDDMVPKMMVMKYFLDVLRPERTKKSCYRIISDINIIATVFTLSIKRKGSDIIASKLMQKNWQKELIEYAVRVFQDIPEAIGYSNVIRENKAITTDSGLHAARRYLSMKDACSFNPNRIQTNEDTFRVENITNGENNIEHFLINRGFSYALYLDDEKTVDVEFTLPKKHRKHIATLANYIIIDRTTNSYLGNRPVYEKIEMLEKSIEEKGIDVVIPSITSRKHYYLAKKIMHDESRYPKKQLKAEVYKSKRKKLLCGYYNDYFGHEYKQLSDSLQDREKIFTAEAEYKLKREGFSLDKEQDNRYIFDHDSHFSNVSAEIDSKNEKILMSAELYNPVYGEENGQEVYETLIEKANSLFTSFFKEAPCLKSSKDYSNCDDESISFNYSVGACTKDIRQFIDNLSCISTELVY